MTLRTALALVLSALALACGGPAASPSAPAASHADQCAKLASAARGVKTEFATSFAKVAGVLLRPDANPEDATGARRMADVLERGGTDMENLDLPDPTLKTIARDYGRSFHGRAVWASGVAAVFEPVARTGAKSLASSHKLLELADACRATPSPTCEASKKQASEEAKRDLEAFTAANDASNALLSRPDYEAADRRHVAETHAIDARLDAACGAGSAKAD